MTNLLNDFFSYRVQKLGCDKKNTSMICLYYQIYGENNELGVTYNTKTHKICYKNSQGEVIYEALGETLQSYMPQESQTYKTSSQKEENDKYETARQRPSNIEKFNARLAKVKNNMLPSGSESTNESE